MSNLMRLENSNTFPHCHVDPVRIQQEGTRAASNEALRTHRISSL